MLEEKKWDLRGDYMGSYVQAKGVDVSSCNGNVDFEKIKRNGFTFAMIRCAFGSDINSQDDNTFEQNVKNAEKAGIPWGAYFYTYALNENDDASELNHILRVLKGKKPLFPIAIDVEDADGYKRNHGKWNYSNVNRNTGFLLNGLKKAGYYPMLYCGYEEIENYISKDIWLNYDMWWAQWNSTCGYKYNNLGMWQYGGETNFIRSPYIEGEIFDQNYCYKDYPSIIKNGGYNGWAKSGGSSTKKKPIEMLAFEVIDGYWGSGEERKKLLNESGYDYNAVQNRVNEICESWSCPKLDENGYKLGEANVAILAIKELLIMAYNLGITTQGVCEDNGFGDGTLIAVNQILKKGKYNQNGIIGENFVKYLSKLIKEKTNK